ELGGHGGADVRMVVAVTRRPPRSHAVQQHAAVREREPHAVGALHDERRRHGLHLAVRQPQVRIDHAAILPSRWPADRPRDGPLRLHDWHRMKKISCFKAYDVRGRVPEDLDEDIAYRIGRGYAAFVKPRTVAVGRDIRASSPALTAALTKGLTDSG